jgi:hypothetical protein
MKKLLVLFLLTTMNLSANVLMISDIDDTIKRTNVLGFMTGGVRTSNPFIGLPELYNAFLCNKEVSVKQKEFCMSKQGVVHSPSRWVTYVTAASGRLQMFGREFIARSRFPMAVVKGKRSSMDSYEFKTAEISSLIDSLGEYEVILVGDNGQKDIAAYDHIAKKYPFKKITTFIHEVYSTYDEDKDKRGVALKKGQIPYLTASDLALEYFSRGWISEKDLNLVSEKVYDFVSSNDDDYYEQVIPKWSKCARFVRDYKRPTVSVTNYTNNLLTRIENRVATLCRGRW